MATASVFTAQDSLKKQFSDLKSRITELDDNLRHLTGRVQSRRPTKADEPPLPLPKPARSRIAAAFGDRRDENPRKRPRNLNSNNNNHNNNPSRDTAIRPRYSIASQIITDADKSRNSKPTLSSAVVAMNPISNSSGSTTDGRPMPGDRRQTRDTFLEEQKKTERNELTRHRRMFGMIMGTLARFQTEESQRKDVAVKRDQVERKLEASEKEERTRVASEKKRIIAERRNKQAQLRQTQLKLDRLSVYQDWEKSHQHVDKFIQTKSKPAICWMPKRLCPVTEKKLKDSKDRFKLIVAERRARVQKELADIDEMFEKDSDHEPELHQPADHEMADNHETAAHDDNNPATVPELDPGNNGDLELDPASSPKSEPELGEVN